MALGVFDYYMNIRFYYRVLFVLLSSLGLSAEEIRWVDIGEVGNPANQLGVGQVDTAYQIMETEVPNWLYCKFLNAVAREEDPYGLWSPLMESHFLGGIVRTFDGSSFKYSVKPRMANKPVTSVSWASCLRFANWFHYGCPEGEEGTLQSVLGDSLAGAYNTDSLEAEGFKDGSDQLRRNPQARYWLPSQDEWVKAGYYAGGGAWSDYPFLSNDVQSSAVNPEIANGANFYENGWAVAAPHLSDVGAYRQSRSYFGTYDQGGNVAEWVEDRVPDSSWFAALGGSVIRGKYSLRLGYREGDALDKPISTFGFRLARRKTGDELWDEQLVLPTRTLDSVEPAELLERKNRTEGAGIVEEFVQVGDLGNEADSLHGRFGRVNYPYEISKCELTNQQYVAFLNAVAVNADPYGLYNQDMSTGVTGGIERKGIAGSYQYAVKAGVGNHPVVYLGYYDLMRYANWRHFGMPKGDCVAGVTEGTSDSGAYDTRDIEKILNGEKAAYASFGVRNAGARYWIPSQDEWYKAAYYDPTRLGPRKYWDFPCRTSNFPENRDAVAMSCNYLMGDQLGVGAPSFLADVDAYAKSASYWGTLQQGGNVWEWIEGWQYGTVGNRGLRGGSWGYTEYGLFAGNTDPGGINDEIYVFGGRIARAYEGPSVANAPLPSMKQILQEYVKNIAIRDVLILVLISFCAGSAVIVFLGVFVVMIRKKRQK